MHLETIETDYDFAELAQLTAGGHIPKYKNCLATMHQQVDRPVSGIAEMQHN
jgi:hypothetical protein